MGSDVQARMQKLLEQVVEEGRERGVQLAAYHKGALIVNAWAGVTDATSRTAVDERTLFPVFSTTKGMAATLLHILAERGMLDYDMPICAVWPEFAGNGKEKITIRHALNHTAGLPNMPVGVGYREMCDWKTMCRLMAAEKPLWPAGQQSKYHAVTFSWLVGEVACRITRKSFGQLLEEGISRPLKLSGMYCGIPDSVEGRVATLDRVAEPPKEPAPATPPAAPAEPAPVPAWMEPLHTMMNRPDARRACIPASNGIMNAISIAKHYAALLPGGVDGVELLPPYRIKIATELQKPSNQVGEPGPRVGLGYMVDGEDELPVGKLRGFGHGGFGGSFGHADRDNHLALAYTNNLYSSRSAGNDIRDALYEALGIKK